MERTHRLFHDTGASLKGTWGYCLLVAAIGALLYGHAATFAFVGDDFYVLRDNRFDLQSIVMSYRNAIEYFPLRDITFALDHAVWGENPRGYHLTSIMLYLLGLVVLFRFYRAINRFTFADQGADTLLPARAFLAAALFAMHPVASETVAIISNRGGLLTLLFCLLACIAFIRFLETGLRSWYGWSLGWFLATLLSKHYGITLPLLLVLIILFSPVAGKGKKLLTVLPFALLSCCFYLFYRTLLMQSSLPNSAAQGLWADSGAKAIKALHIVLFYLVRMLWSDRALVEFVNLDRGALGAVGNGLLLLAIIAGCFLVRKRCPQLLFGVCFYLITILPFLNLFRTYPEVADRYLFFPMTGLLLPLTALPLARYRYPVLGSILALGLFWSAATLRAETHLRDNVAYWESVLHHEQTAENVRHLAGVYMDSRRFDDARALLDREKARLPEFEYLLLLGLLHHETDSPAEAIAVCRRALALPGHPPEDEHQLYEIMGDAYVALGDYDQALPQYRAAFDRDSRNAGLANTIGVIYGTRREFETAVAFFQKALALDEGYEKAHINLALTYCSMGKTELARSQAELVRRKFPNRAGGMDEALAGGQCR